ncbi:OmpA family protein [Sphingomonas sp.]|uniref:OmpA family protein n=1 Tax=Sphingomonas sp. TaxID=28214 RepID=UPI003B008934
MIPLWRGAPLVATLLATAAAAQTASEEATADAAARAALPRAEIRTLLPEVRTIQGLGGGIGGDARTISGAVVPIASLQRSLAGDGLATRLVGGRLEVSLPGDVLFDFDKATIRPDAIPTLAKVADAAARSGRPITVEGHTDARGGPSHNRPLSEARARAVADRLVAAGIERARITSVGFGATRPVAPNSDAAGRDDPAGRQRNRRVAVVL